MGIYDRDYMKEGASDKSPSAKQLFIVAGQIALVFIGMFICLRLPLPGVLRLGFALGTLVFGMAYILVRFRRY